MKLPPGVIEALHSSLAAHWTAVRTYAAQAGHFRRWGYARLAEKAQEDVKEELEHIAAILARMEMADDGDPAATWPRHDLPGILAANLSLETQAAMIERAGITTAREAMDEGSAVMFTANLAGSEQAIREIEAAQGIITKIGLDNFLADQI